MNVVIAAGIYPPDVGGPATYAESLAAYLSHTGQKVQVICYSDTEGDAHDATTRVFRIRRNIKFLTFVRYCIKLNQLVDTDSVVYAQGPVAGGMQALLISKIRSTPYMVKVTGDYAWEQAAHRYAYGKTIEAFQHEHKLPMMIRGIRFFQRLVVRHAETVIVPSKYLQEIVSGWKADEKKIQVIRNAVSVRNASADDREKYRQSFAFKGFTILSGGRLVPWKGFDGLIKAFSGLHAQYPSASLVIVGDGPERSSLEELIQHNHLEQCVVLAGKQSAAMMNQYYEAADMFMLNSSYEGLSHMLLEAQSHSLPCAASLVGGNAECIVDGETGLLFPHNDIEKIKDSMEFYLNHADKRKAFAEKARQQLESWTTTMMFAKTGEVVQSALHTTL